MIFCVSIFVMLIGAAVVVGHGQPPSVALQQLHLLDCALPCWIGIVPGETRIDEAVQHVSETFRMEMTLADELFGSAWFVLPLPTNTNPTNTVSLRLDYDGGVIYGIRIDFSHDADAYGMPHMGEIANLVGTPTCVDHGTFGSQNWALVYDMLGGVITILARHDEPIGWTQSMSGLYIIHPSEFTSPVCYGLFSWRGLYRYSIHDDLELIINP